MLTLGARDVHVWYVVPDDAAAPPLVRRYEALLAPAEDAQYRRFVFDVDRHRYLVARALVRTTLSRYAAVDPQSWTFAANAFGRPEIAGPGNVPPLRFSLTHTNGLVAMAIAQALDVGLDAEPLDRAVSDTAGVARHFADAEAQALAALPPDEQARAFLEYWTLKEAYIKATGEGLSRGLDSFAVERSTPPSIRFLDGHDDPAAWQFAQPAMSDRHLAALAVRCPYGAPAVSIHRAVPLADFSIPS